jgi:hypothetical protein
MVTALHKSLLGFRQCSCQTCKHDICLLLTVVAYDQLCISSPFIEQKLYGLSAITSDYGSIVIDSSSYINDVASSAQSVHTVHRSSPPLPPFSISLQHNDIYVHTWFTSSRQSYLWIPRFTSLQQSDNYVYQVLPLCNTAITTHTKCFKVQHPWILLTVFYEFAWFLL